ncbi:MAG TPA: hypothetical protein VFD58_33195 [Blastocatellia bacterium]|nr:hypothetical protein [Blastocatellia bacterium]
MDEKDSPVILSSPAFSYRNHPDRPNDIEVTGHHVEIINRTREQIRLAYLSFTYELPEGGGYSSVGQEEHLAPGEKRLVIRNNISVRWHHRGDLTLKVRLLGVEFVGGKKWVSERTVEYPLDPQRFLLHGSCPLSVRSGNRRGDAFFVKLRMNEDQVTGYRVGMVRDLPGKFEVRLGAPVALEVPARKDSELTINSDHPKELGFTAGEIFQTEMWTRVTRDGRTITATVGVAFFIAEVTFADGRVWHKELSREEVLWEY